MDFKKVILWAITIFLGLVFIMTGASKLTSPAQWQARFVGDWGVPGRLVPIVGIAEMVGGALLMAPRAAVYGGSIIAIIMLGATGTLVVAGDYAGLGVTLPFGVLAAFVGYYRARRRTPS